MTDDQLREARQRVRDRYGSSVAEKASDSFCMARGREAAVENVGAAATIIEFAGAEVPTAPEAAADPAAQRDRFYREIGPLAAELARATGRPGAAPEAAVGGQPPSEAELCWLNWTMRTWVVSHEIAEVAADPAVRGIDLPVPLEPELLVTTTTVGAVKFREQTDHTGAGVIVAVIDGEVPADHPYLKGRVAQRHNHTSEPWGSPHPHGTAVAGIVAAAGEDLSGVATEATIYSYKVFTTDPLLRGDDFDGAMALQRALEDGAHVANCSWGVGPAGDGTSRAARACDTAWGVGLTIVKSAGNGGRIVTSPAEADGIIVVGGTNRAGSALGSYSNHGPTPGGQQRPHLVAPGGAVGDSIRSCLTNGDVGSIGGPGTSYAAPHVAGILALVLQDRSDLTPDGQRDLLLSLCTPLDGVDEHRQGAGLVSMEKMP